MIETIPQHLLPERDPGIYEAGRTCSVCHCLLSRNNPRNRCAPCQLAAMPECEVIGLFPEDAA